MTRTCSLFFRVATRHPYNPGVQQDHFSVVQTETFSVENLSQRCLDACAVPSADGTRRWKLPAEDRMECRGRAALTSTMGLTKPADLVQSVAVKVVLSSGVVKAHAAAQLFPTQEEEDEVETREESGLLDEDAAECETGADEPLVEASQHTQQESDETLVELGMGSDGRGSHRVFDGWLEALRAVYGSNRQRIEPATLLVPTDSEAF